MLGPEIVLFEHVWVAPLLLEPIEMPVRLKPVAAGAVVILETVLFDTLVPLPPKFELNAVIELVPPLQLLKVLPVIVLVGPLAVEAPLALLKPTMLVAPVTVILEKLLLVSL